MGGRIRAKGQVVAVGALAQMVEHHSRLHPGIFLFRIKFKNLVQIFGKINHHGHIAALPGQACASATRQNRCAIFAGQRHRLHHVFDGSRYHHSNRYLAVIGAIRGIESAAAFVKADFAVDALAQLCGQNAGALARELLV